MFWLAASFAASLASLSGIQLNREEAAAWHRIEPSVAVLHANGAARGTGVLIAPGWVLAQRSVIGSSESVSRQFYNGGTIQFRVVKNDGATQLVLLKAEGSTDGHTTAPLFRGGGAEISTSHPLPVMAVLTSGAIPAELVSTNEVGVVNGSRAAIQFSEIQFESAPSSVRGAPVFTMDGHLVGILGATLAPAASSDSMTRSFAVPSSKSGINVGPKKFGPAGMIVAYSPNPETMARVVDGFLTPSHEVQRPGIGVFCKNAPHGGVVVQSVLDGSPAETAGIRRGDVITSINGQAVGDLVDFAKAITKQKVGSTVPIAVKRGTTHHTFEVRIGV